MWRTLPPVPLLVALVGGDVGQYWLVVLRRRGVLRLRAHAPSVPTFTGVL
jgi:hypothetical protein